MKITAHSYFGHTGGCASHAENFFNALERRGVEVLRSNIPKPGSVPTDGIHIILCGVQEFAHVMKARSQAIKGMKIAYVAWETTEYPAHFVEALRQVDQLWVPSEWQRLSSIVQLAPLDFPPDFVRVVPEGVDGSVFFPGMVKKDRCYRRFMIFGRWEDRKCTTEMIRHWLDTFKTEMNVELLVSADNAFPVDNFKTTEERLVGYGLEDPRIKVVHYPPREEYVKCLQEGHVLLNVSRGEGWGLPIGEGMACGIPVVCTDWSGNTQFHKGACTVPTSGLIAPFNVYGVENCPGHWAEPNWESYRWWLRELYDNYGKYLKAAIAESARIRTEYSWDEAAQKAMLILEEFKDNVEMVATPPATSTPPSGKMIDLIGAAYQAGFEVDRSYSIHGGYAVLTKKEKSVFVIGGYPEGQNKMETLMETVGQIHAMGYKVVITTKYALPAPVQELADFVLYDKEGESPIRNAVLFCADRWDRIHYMEYDMEVDLDDFICRVAMSRKPVVTAKGNGLFSGRIEHLAEIFKSNVPAWESEDVDRMDIDADCRFPGRDGLWPNDKFECHFVGGPYLNISGMSNKEYMVTFASPEKGDDYQLFQKPGMWSRPKTKYYQDWTIRAEYNGVEVFRHHMDLKGKRVLVSMGSKALGDTIAWFPYVLEFQKKHECHVVAASWWREILDYPELEIVAPGTVVEGVYASLNVGCFDNDPTQNVSDWRSTPMQKIATDILGLDYRPLKPKLKTFTGPRPSEKYVCFSEFSTMRTKLWNYPHAWQKTVDHLNEIGFIPVSISKEPTNLSGCKKFNNRKIEDTMAVLSGASFFIGLGSGPSWLAWALNIPVIMISGFSADWCEFENPHRIINKDVCHGCFSDPNETFDRGWNWCPRKEWNGRPVVEYECTKEITPEMVKEHIAVLAGG